MGTTGFVGLALLLAAPLPKIPPKASPSVVGEWVAQSRTFAGTERPIAGEPLRYVFAGDGTYAVYRGSGKLVEDRKYTTDPKKDPAAIDLDTEAAGARVYRGIFKIEGDTMTVCWANGDDQRPAAFESTAAKPTTSYVFMRVKKE